MDQTLTVNINVLRRHVPNIVHIHDSTSYVVLYRFSKGSWSKTGLEGSLFIYQRDISPFYGVFVLNRVGLDNFDEPLVEKWDVDLDDGLVIWRNENATGDGDDDVIHGIWVYEAEHRERITLCMQSLIAQDEAMHREETPAPPSISHPVPRIPILPGQSITVEELFGLANSVSAEPPPITSALPLPGQHNHSGNDIYNLERQVRSPDPSELPGGMQLLDNLFQKAGLKQQQQQNLQMNNATQQPLQLTPTQTQQNQPPPMHLHDTPPTTAQSPPTQDQPATQQRDASRPRQRRSSSTEEPTYQPVTAYGQPLPQPNQSGAGHWAQQHSGREARGHSHSRRSSGSSDHGGHRHGNRDGSMDKPGGVPQNAQMVPAPVPVMDPQEARMGILGMIKHPAAVGDGSGTGNPHGSPSSNPSNAYGQGGYRPQQNYAPQPYGQQYQPQMQAGYAPMPPQGPYGQPQQGMQSNAAQSRNTPPSGSPYGPITQSQYQQQYGQPAPGNQPPPMQDPGSPGARHKPYQAQQWAHNDLPKRALSPLNPAAQANGGRHQGYVANGRNPSGGRGPNGGIGGQAQTSYAPTTGQSGGAPQPRIMTGAGGHQGFSPTEYVSPQSGPLSPAQYGPPATQVYSPGQPSLNNVGNNGTAYGSPAYNTSSSQGSQGSYPIIQGPHPGSGGQSQGNGGGNVYAPQVNDSSRPRQSSQGSGSHHASGGGNSGGGGGGVTSGGAGGGSGMSGVGSGVVPGKTFSPKWIADALDEALQQNGPLLRDGGEEGTLERREFREAVVQLLCSNSHFVDHVYSRYLNRKTAEGW